MKTDSLSLKESESCRRDVTYAFCHTHFRHATPLYSGPHLGSSSCVENLLENKMGVQFLSANFLTVFLCQTWRDSMGMRLHPGLNF